jgi:hypothetical protein
MDQPPPLSSPEQQASLSGTPVRSLPSRLINVFAAPGEVFEEVKARPPVVWNWLAPALLFLLVGAVSAVVIFSRPTIQQQLRDQQAKKMDELVKAGKMRQADADHALEIMEKFTGPTMMAALGIVFAGAAGFIRLFWWALLLWLAARWVLKRNPGYRKMLEVAGLASMIVVLGAVVTLLLTAISGRMFMTPSLALMVNEFDVSRKSHLLLAAVNAFYLWQAIVFAVGLSKMADVSFGRALPVVLACYVLQELVFVFCPGMGQMAI